jgi:hypothetical protein
LLKTKEFKVGDFQSIGSQLKASKVLGCAADKEGKEVYNYTEIRRTTKLEEKQY